MGRIVEALRTPLYFEVPGRSLHCPMVEATVAGVKMLLILDTGATTQILTIDLVDRAGLDRELGEPGTDVAGKAVTSWTVTCPTIEIDETSFVAEDVVAITAPEPFPDWGIGGFISPQALWPTDTVVVDLAAHQLVVFSGIADADGELLDSTGSQPLVLTGAHHAAGTVGIEVAVVPHEPVVALLDTGANLTEVSVNAVTAKPGEKVAGGRSVSGVDLRVSELRDQVLRFGEARLVMPTLSLRDHIPVPEGAPKAEKPNALIGMDLLDGTILEISPRASGGIRWFVPTDRSQR